MQVVDKAMSQAAYSQGYEVTYSPRNGFEKRDRMTSCYVVISDDKVSNPRKKKQDILVALKPKAYTRFKENVKPGGTWVVNSVPLHEIVVNLGNTKVISAALVDDIAVLLEDEFPTRSSCWT